MLKQERLSVFASFPSCSFVAIIVGWCLCMFVAFSFYCIWLLAFQIKTAAFFSFSTHKYKNLSSQ
jgi:hypothetical protein